MSIEQIATQLTVQQINDQLYSRVFSGLIFSLLAIVGSVWGTKAKNNIERYVGFILTAIGAIGALVYTQLIVDSLKLIG